MADIIDFEQVPTSPAEAPKFDPKKKYQWAKDAQFILNGGEFGFILSTLRGVVGTQEAQAVFMANEALGIVESVFGKRKDGSVSKRGLWDNIRAAKGSGKKPTAQMLKQEKKIKAKTKK